MHEMSLKAEAWALALEELVDGCPAEILLDTLAGPSSNITCDLVSAVVHLQACELLELRDHPAYLDGLKRLSSEVLGAGEVAVGSQDLSRRWLEKRRVLRPEHVFIRLQVGQKLGLQGSNAYASCVDDFASTHLSGHGILTVRRRGEDLADVALRCFEATDPWEKGWVEARDVCIAMSLQSHPVFNRAMCAAAQKLGLLQSNTWFSEPGMHLENALWAALNRQPSSAKMGLQKFEAAERLGLAVSNGPAYRSCLVRFAVDTLGVPREHLGDAHFTVGALRSAVQKWVDSNEVPEGILMLKQLQAAELFGVHAPKIKSRGRDMARFFKLPGEWDLSRVLAAIGNGDAMLLRKLSLDEASGAISAFQALFDLTFTDRVTADRRFCEMPRRLIVEGVEMVRNWSVYRDYVARREEVARAKKSEWPAQVKLPLTASWREAVPAENPFLECMRPLRADVNEHLLFHGTRPECADKIAGDNFRLNLSGTFAGTLYGRGIYLAERVSKSDEYTGRGLQGTIIVCRVTLGKLQYNCEARPDRSELESSCGLGSKALGEFQSVCGDREVLRGTYREFIVFDDDLVYPEFLVRYRRQY